MEDVEPSHMKTEKQKQHSSEDETRLQRKVSSETFPLRALSHQLRFPTFCLHF